MELHLEGGQAIGLHLEGRARQGLRPAVLLDAELGGVLARGRIVLLPGSVDAARAGHLHRKRPAAAPGGPHLDLSRAPQGRELALVAQPHEALEVDLVGRPVDGTLGEEVPQPLAGLPSSLQIREHPLQPARAATVPVAVSEHPVGARPQHQRVRATRHHDPSHAHRGVPAWTGRIPDHGSHLVGPTRPQRLEGRRLTAVAHHAVHPHRGARHGLASGQGADGEPHVAWILHRRQRQVRDLHPHPRPLGARVQAAHPHQVVPRLLGPRQARQGLGQVEAEARRRGLGLHVEVHDGGDARRAEGGEASRELARRDVAFGDPVLGLLAGPRRPARLVHGEGPVGEGPEVPVEWIDLVDAQIGATVATALHGHLLGTVALQDPLPHTPAQEGRLAWEVQPYRSLGVELQRASRHILQHGGGDAHPVGLVGLECAPHHQGAPRNGVADVGHRRLEAHEVAPLDGSNVGQRSAEAHLNLALRPTSQRVLPGLLAARQPHGHRLAATPQSGHPEGLSGGERHRGDGGVGVVEGQAEPHGGPPPQTDGMVQHQGVPRRIRRTGAIQHLHLEVALREPLSRTVADPRQGAHVDGDHARERVGLDRSGKREHDPLDLGQIGGSSRWARGRRRRHQGGEGRRTARPLDLHREDLQRRVGLRRPKLQRARVEPGPGSGPVGLQGDPPIRIGLRAPAARPLGRWVEHGDRVVGSKEPIGHHHGAVVGLGALEQRVQHHIGAPCRGHDGQPTEKHHQHSAKTSSQHTSKPWGHPKPRGRSGPHPHRKDEPEGRPQARRARDL